MSSSDSRTRYGLLGSIPGMRAWGDANPVPMALLQGLLFGVLFGVLNSFVFESHASLGADLVRSAIAAVLFGLVMYFVNVRQRASR
jgi:hypothetical protein